MKTVSGPYQPCLAKVIQTVNETFEDRKSVLVFSVTSYGEACYWKEEWLGWKERKKDAGLHTHKGVFHLSSGYLVDAWQQEPVNTGEISSSVVCRAEILVLA